MQNRSAAFVFGGFLSLLGVFLLFSCFAAFIGTPDTSIPALLFVVPGRFFLGAFHVAGLYVPIFVLLQAVFLFRREFPQIAFRVLNTSVLPFFTIGLLLQLATRVGESSSPIAVAAERAFGLIGSIILTLVLLAVELLLLAIVSGAWAPARARRRSDGPGE